MYDLKANPDGDNPVVPGTERPYIHFGLLSCSQWLDTCRALTGWTQWHRRRKKGIVSETRRPNYFWPRDRDKVRTQGQSSVENWKRLPKRFLQISLKRQRSRRGVLQRPELQPGGQVSKVAQEAASVRASWIERSAVSVELKALSQHRSSEQVCEMRRSFITWVGWERSRTGSEERED
jgi:hypothetical protein